MAAKHTASFTRFFVRCEELYKNLQLVDVALCNATRMLANAKRNNSSIPICEALGCNPDVYPKLCQPVENYSEWVGLARSKQSEYAICQLYSYFTHYLRDVLKEMYPLQSYLVSQLNGEHISKQHLSYKEIIDLNNYESIANEIVNRVFRAMENKRDTKSLIDKIQESFNLTIEDDIKDRALCYLELRHLLIHNKGFADEKYIQAFNRYYTSSLEVNKRIHTTFLVYKSAQFAIHKLCATIDTQLFQIIKNSLP